MISYLIFISNTRVHIRSKSINFWIVELHPLLDTMSKQGNVYLLLYNLPSLKLITSLALCLYSLNLSRAIPRSPAPKITIQLSQKRMAK